MITGSPLRAILIDVGGPIVDERPEFNYGIEVVRNLLIEELGREVDAREINAARERAIMSWAPSFTKSVLWQFLKPDTERTQQVFEKAVELIYSYRSEVSLMEGAAVLLDALSKKYMLALAGNQPRQIKDKLEKTGLMKYFKSTVLSSDIGLRKPDSRFFLEICRRIDAAPGECVMIGDRLDNDIFPANVLGMRTIWVRVGPHALQQPRLPEDVPDAIVGDNMLDVIGVIEGWDKIKLL